MARSGTRLIDRPEFKTKPKPVTFLKSDKVSDAISIMSEKNYGSVIIVDNKDKVIGVVTERDIVKKHILIMGEDVTSPQVKYIHGNYGKGTFTFLGGHDPEDYQHFVGDPQTDLSLYKNSPGYRLILNNILFPAAKKKERKT